MDLTHNQNENLNPRPHSPSQQQLIKASRDMKKRNFNWLHINTRSKGSRHEEKELSIYEDKFDLVGFSETW